MGMSEETKAKMRAAWTPERRKRQRQRMTGNVLGKERRGKSGTLKGRTYEEIHGPKEARRLREARSIAWKGKPKSEQTRQKLSEIASARLGELNPFYGRKHTDETKRKISDWRRAKYGGRRTVYEQVRSYFKLKDWRKAVFERDDYTCQVCGVRNTKGLGRSVKLHAHHIKPLSEIVGNKTFEECIALSELYDIGNGITLCVSCHMQIHRRPNE